MNDTKIGWIYIDDPTKIIESLENSDLKIVEWEMRISIV